MIVRFNQLNIGALLANEPLDITEAFVIKKENVVADGRFKVRENLHRSEILCISKFSKSTFDEHLFELFEMVIKCNLEIQSIACLS